MERVEIGNAVLWRGDCLEVMAQFENKEIDAVVTDPPYGIGQAGKDRRRVTEKNCRTFKNQKWDVAIPAEKYFVEMFRISRNQVIFGGNFFSDRLPPSRGWLYWDKKIGGDYADGELIFTNQNKVLSSFSYCSQRPGNVHPTQKPVKVMQWCMQYVDDLKTDSLVVDPYMGSGSTGVACYDLGYQFIGIEKEIENFDIACKRIETAQRQANLFEPGQLAL